MKTVMFLGAPGTGKGTYTTAISEKLGIPHISSGDILRAARDDPEFGKEIAKHQDAGVPVPDEIAMKLIKKRVTQPDCKKGALLDAITYNIEQAKILDKLLKIDLVINLVLPDDIVIQKNAARRTCSVCGDPSYNIADIKDEKRGIYMPALLPKVAGKCDKCGGKLIQRSDDCEEVMKKRLDVYKVRIAPVLEHYRKKEIVVDFHVNNEPKVMVPKLLKIIEESS